MADVHRVGARLCALCAPDRNLHESQNTFRRPHGGSVVSRQRAKEDRPPPVLIFIVDGNVVVVRRALAARFAKHGHVRRSQVDEGFGRAWASATSTRGVVPVA
jgi:hypothetical protein